MFDTLNEENFVLWAAKHYENPQCHDAEEFFDDLKRFKYLKRLFSKYHEGGELKDRLIMNHLVILFNIFEQGTNKMLFYKLDGYYSYLKPFLILLNRMPNRFYDSKGVLIHSSDIVLDQKIVDTLRKI